VTLDRRIARLAESLQRVEPACPACRHRMGKLLAVADSLPAACPQCGRIPETLVFSFTLLGMTQRRLFRVTDQQALVQAEILLAVTRRCNTMTTDEQERKQ
jgi:hypothetical protein